MTEHEEPWKGRYKRLLPFPHRCRISRRSYVGGQEFVKKAVSPLSGLLAVIGLHWKPWAMISRPLWGATPSEQPRLFAALGLDPNSQRPNAAAGPEQLWKLQARVSRRPVAVGGAYPVVAGRARVRECADPPASSLPALLPQAPRLIPGTSKESGIPHRRSETLRLVCGWYPWRRSRPACVR